MATLADELLNDFEDDDGQEEEEGTRDLAEGDDAASVPAFNGTKSTGEAQDGGGMDLDDDEEAVGEDEELMNGSSVNKAMEDAEDADETKHRVEKMQLGGVSDVRSVAGLMKSLEPVLEVSILLMVFTRAPFTLNRSPDFFRRPTENRTLSEPTFRTAEQKRRLD